MGDSPKRFRVAFSFAGEKREFVAPIASILASRFGEHAILYDKYHEAEFARSDLGIFLPDLYHHESDLIVVVICPDYDKKEWPGLEWKAIYGLLKKRKESDVMLCRFEHAEVKGLYIAGYVELDSKTPEQTAALILERLALNEGKPKDHYTKRPAESESDTVPADFLPDYPEPQSKWVGRKSEMTKLRRAWRDRRRRIQSVVGFGGEGKTALTRRFTESLRRAADEKDRPLVVWWSFYFNKAADAFFAAVLTHFGIPLTEEGHPLAAEQRARKLVDLLRTGVNGRRLLLVLDGLENLQDDTVGREGRVTDTGLRELLRATLNDAEPDTDARGMILITTRQSLSDVRREGDVRCGELGLEQLSRPDGAALLTEQYGLEIETPDAQAFAGEVHGHALTLTLVGGLLSRSGRVAADLSELRQVIAKAKVTDPDLTARHKRFHELPGYVLRHCAKNIRPAERQFLRLLSCCVRPATRLDIEEVFLHPLRTTGGGEPFNDKLAGREYGDIATEVVQHLRELRLIDGNEQGGYDMHPLVRGYFYEQETGRGKLTVEQRKAVHSRFYDVLPARQEKHYPDTLEQMRPLLDAVQHGCRAGRAQAALDECYYTRIDRVDQPHRTTSYLTSDLGAVETNLELLRGFFPIGDFGGEPMVTAPNAKAFLIGAAALSMSTTGRPNLAIPLFQRALSTNLAHPGWANASMDCQNLCNDHMALGGLTDAAAAAANALNYAGKMPDEHQFKNAYTQFSHANAAMIAALGGDDETAFAHFAAAIKLDPDDWLFSIMGDYHCTWLARCAEYARARSAGQKNAQMCAERGGLHWQTSALATQGLIERLAWAAGDPDRAGVEVMAGHARRAIDIGRRSGFHFYLTFALLEAGRCAVTRARHDPPNRPAHVAEATRYLDEAEQRAADVGYRLILADLHVARAELAKLAGDEDTMRDHCAKAIAICDAPDCGYAWAREDADALLE